MCAEISFTKCRILYAMTELGGYCPGTSLEIVRGEGGLAFFWNRNLPPHPGSYASVVPRITVPRLYLLFWFSLRTMGVLRFALQHSFNLFVIFLKTNKHQNVACLRSPNILAHKLSGNRKIRHKRGAPGSRRQCWHSLLVSSEER